MEEDLHAADAVYQKTLDAMPAGEAKGRLREAQRAWIAYRDAELVLYGSMGTNLRGVEITQTELAQDRTKRLRGIAQDARNGTVQ